MKKYITIICVSLSLLVYTGCDSLLDEDTSTFPSASLSYSNDETVNSALTGCYSPLLNYSFFGSDYATIFATCGGTITNQSSSYVSMRAQKVTPDNKYIGRHFQYHYLVISYCNDLLDKINASGASDELKTRAKGEAHLLRGMMYFNLVRAFGGVPLRISPTTSTNLDLPRSTADETYKQIISDLNDAATELPEKNPVTGRPNKYAAHALLAKVYITMANGVANSEYWQKCLDECNQVYGHFSLVPIKELYNPTNRNCAESIIEIQFSDVIGNTWTQGIAPTLSDYTPNQTSAPYARYRPSRYIFDTWKAQYPGDPRFEETFIYNSYTTGGGKETVKIYPLYNNPSGSSKNYPYIKKFLDSRYIATYTNQNYIYLRYADVLLMMAEATNEISGADKAYQYVNEVLKRARESYSPATTEPADWSGMTQDEFRNRIMYERLYELFAEQQEYFDLRRRGAQFLLNYWTAHNANPSNIKGSSVEKYNDNWFTCTLDAAKKALLLPFPLTEISSNNKISDSDQNPGY